MNTNGNNGTNGVNGASIKVGIQQENGLPEKDDNGRDPVTGQFVKGYQGGPGRPRGSMDFMQVCRKRARETGVSIEDLVWQVAESLFKNAINGDIVAAKLILDRSCGLLDKGTPAVAVQVNGDGAQITAGPPVPNDGDLGTYIQRLAEVAGDQGLLPEPEDD